MPKVVCYHCEGEGTWDSEPFPEFISCEYCEGTGEVEEIKE